MSVTTPMPEATSTTPAPETSPESTAHALATDALEAAKGRGHSTDEAVHVARKKLWDARLRSVLADDTTKADLYLEALAHLGDKGGKRAVADRAAAAKGGRA